MAVYINYNGFVAPLDPASAQYYDTFTTNYGMTLVFKLDGAYYLITTGQLGARQAGVDTAVTPAMFWTALKNQYKLNSQGQWVKTSRFTAGQYIAPIDDMEIIYFNAEVFYLALGTTGIWPNTYRAKDAAATVVTEYAAMPTVTAYGWNDYPGVNTDGPKVKDQWLPLIAGEDAKNWRLNVYLVCHATVPDGGTVTVEWYRNGELYATSTANGSVESHPQPTCDELGAFTYHAVVTHYDGTYYRSVTMDSFTLTVVEWNLDTNTPEGDDDSIEIGDGIYEGIEPEVTAEARRLSFWKGFGSGVGMYGGGVTVTGEAVAASESGSGTTSEAKAAFWKGAACGAAMYGGGKGGGTSAEPDSGGDSDSGSEDTGGEEEIPNGLRGTWVISESPGKSGAVSQEVNFESDGTAFVRFHVNSVAMRYGTVLTYTDSQTTYPDAFIWSSIYGGPRWANEAFRTVDFGDTPQVVSESFYTWFTANAIKKE